MSNSQILRGFTLQQITNFTFIGSSFISNLVYEYLVKCFNFFDLASTIVIKALSFVGITNKNLGFGQSFLNFLNTQSLIVLNDTIFQANTLSNMSLFSVSNNTNSLQISNCSVLRNEILDNFSPQFRLYEMAIISFISSNFQLNNNLNQYRNGSTLIQIKEYSQVVFLSSQFLYNYAFSTTVVLELMNYLYIMDTYPSIIVTNCSFLNNLANYSSVVSNDMNLYGEVISFYTTGKIMISSSNFSDNSIFLQDPSTEVGSPCIYGQANDFSSALLVSNCLFYQNEAFSMSSCIYFEGSYFYLSNSVFQLNTILKSKIIPNSFYSSIWKKGSNIFLNVLSTNLVNCSFDQAFGMFGAVMCLTLNYDISDDNPFSSQLGEFNFTNLVVTNAQSLNDGGVIQIEVFEFGNAAVFLFQQCIFENSLSNFHGGVFNFLGLFTTPSNMIFMQCNFISNLALKGGVLYNLLSKNSILFNQSTFISNEALDSEEGGGVIFNAVVHHFLVWNCSFINNYANFRASLIYSYHGSYQDEGSIYFNNTSGGEAGMMFLLNDVLVSMNYSTINISFSTQKGGFAIAQVQCNVFLTNCALYNISSSSSAFIYSGEESNFNISNTILSNFYSYDGTGQIVSVKGTNNILEFDNCSIYNWNTLTRSHFEVRSNNFILKNSQIFESNGLFLWASFSQISIDNLTIINYNCLATPGSQFCLFNFGNIILMLNNLNIMNITLTNRQSLLKCIQCTLNVTLMNITTVNVVNPYIINPLYQNLIFFIRESTYNFTNGIISNLNLTAFQIILASGIFENIIVNNSLNSTIQGQFISCFICIYLELSSCKINGMTTDIGPVIQINDIYDSFFFQTLTGYNLIEIMEQSLTLYIHDSIFSNNKAIVQGGAFYILDFSLLVENSIFIENSAVEGGALYLNCSEINDNDVCNWTIRTSQFINNSAYIRGGALHWLNTEPILEDSNVFENNMAGQGSKFSSNPIKLQLDDFDESEEFVSGYPSPNATLTIYLLDAYDQIYYDTNSLGYLIFDKSQDTNNLLQKFVSNQFEEIIDGSFFFEDFTIVSQPGHDVYLLVYSDAITSVSPYLNLSAGSPHQNISNQYYFSFSIHIRNCNQGEIYQSDLNLCFPCPDGSYSFDPSDPQCYQCPTNAICLKNQPFQVQIGYWRISPNSSVLYRCNIKKAGCAGGTYDNQCNYGYTGPMCSACLYNDTLKFFNNFGGCSKCGSSNTFLVLITVIILLVAVVGLIFFSIKDSETFLATKGDLQEVLMTVLINILINFTQLFSVVSNIDIKWPSFFSSSSSSSSPTSVTDFIGVLECPIASYALGHNFSIFYVEMVMLTLLFMIMLVGNLIFWFLFKVIRKKCLKKPPHTLGNLKNDIILTYIAIYVLMLQPLLNFYTKAFNCIEVGDGVTIEYFLKVAPEIQCWGDTHISLIKNVIVPFFLIFIIPPPLIMLYYTAKNYKSTKDEIIQRLFMVTIGYKPKYCYWEFVILLKKIILIYLSIFIRDEPVICVLTLLFVLLVFCNLHLIFKPYQYEFLNNLIVEQYVALFVCYSVFLYFSYSDDVGSSVFLILIMFFANVIFLGHWGYYFYIYFKKSLHNIRNAIRKTTESVHSAILKRRKNAIMRSQSSISKNKNTPRGSKFINQDDIVKILKTTPGKSQIGSRENCEIVEKPFISERKMEEKGDENQVEKFPEMLIIQEGK